ncbi:MAG: hypothetical protein O3B72_11215 [Proteobacteria bacterium]|nr:hypothetical protein [Pseudomonadota bacterium]
MSESQTTSSGYVRWLFGSRHGLEGFLYLGHRVSGLLLLLFVICHILLSSSRLISMELWADLMLMTRSPWVQVLHYPMLAAFAFHAMNGIRLLLVETGFFIGRPEQQVYPYHGSITRQRPLSIVMMLLAGLLIITGELDVLRYAH